MSAFNDPRLLKHERERREGPRCKECGYDLTGLTLSTACPECGTARQEAGRRRLDPQTAKILEASGLDLARYQVGFALAGLALIGAPVLVIWTAISSPLAVRWALVGVAGVWALSVYALLSFRFYEVRRTDRLAEAARWGALGTQWVWAVAAMLPMVSTGGWMDIARSGLLVIGGVGLMGTFWEYGNLLDWAGDDAGGGRVRGTVPYFMMALAWAYFGVSFVMYRMPVTVLWIPTLSLLVFFGPLLWFYFRIAADLLGGMSMAHWARVKQVNDSGRQERIDAIRAEIEAEQGVRVDREERAVKARRAGADRAVGLDDFSD